MDKIETGAIINDWLKFGLKLPSVVRVHKMATLEKDMIEEIMGYIDETILDKVRLYYMSIPVGVRE